MTWRIRLTALCAMAAVAVSVIYLPQSLLTDLAHDLGTSEAAASAIATAVQAGYAVGILLLVPLADRVHPRRQVTVQALLLAGALALTALLPTIAAVAVGFLVVGLVANIAQVLIPTANRLAPEGRPGATTSALLGALLVGIFGGRIVASSVVEAIGWRWVAVAFALFVVLLVPPTRAALDVAVPQASSGRPYPALVAGSFRLLRSSPVLAQSAVTQMFVFAAFNSMWTVTVLHLTSGEIDWTVRQAGLFGLVGLAAGALTPVVGRVVDRAGALRVAGAVLVVLLAATGSVVVDSDSVVLFGVSMFFVSWANQGIQAATQSRGIADNLHEAAQANTIYMALVFVGGSAGAVLGPIAFDRGGMSAVALQALLFVVVALGTWLFSLRTDARVRHSGAPSQRATTTPTSP